MIIYFATSISKANSNGLNALKADKRLLSYYFLRGKSKEEVISYIEKGECSKDDKEERLIE